MELEDCAKNAEVLFGRAVQVEPEEAVVLKEVLDRFAVEGHLGGAAGVNDLARRRPAQLFCRAGGMQARRWCQGSPRTVRELCSRVHVGRSGARA